MLTQEESFFVLQFQGLEIIYIVHKHATTSTYTILGSNLLKRKDQDLVFSVSVWLENGIPSSIQICDTLVFCIFII